MQLHRPTSGLVPTLPKPPEQHGLRLQVLKHPSLRERLLNDALELKEDCNMPSEPEA
jgi:hypothetical protein